LDIIHFIRDRSLISCFLNIFLQHDFSRNLLMINCFSLKKANSMISKIKWINLRNRELAEKQEYYEAFFNHRSHP
jgi:hypothetical protein